MVGPPDLLTQHTTVSHCCRVTDNWRNVSAVHQEFLDFPKSWTWQLFLTTLPKTKKERKKETNKKKKKKIKGSRIPGTLVLKCFTRFPLLDSSSTALFQNFIFLCDATSAMIRGSKKKPYIPSKVLQKSFIGNAFVSLAVMYQQNKPHQILGLQNWQLWVFCTFAPFLKGPVEITAAVHCKRL